MTASNVLGRPRSFDEQEVLDSLMRLFWQKGYAATTTADIVETSGVHKPTLYRIFGKKDELFATILRRYLSDQMTVVDEMINSASPGTPGIHEFIDAFAQFAGNEATPDGCLLVMASNELNGTIPGYEHFATEYRAALRDRLLRLVSRTTPASAEGPALTEHRSFLLTTLLAGFQVAARAGANEEEVHQIVASIHATIETW